MRLFVALLPPPEILDELDRAVEPHRGGWPGLRWVRREVWHVTLTFIGEVDERVVERLTPRLERAAGRYSEFELRFAGAGVFPAGARARVLWTGLYGDRRTLTRLASATTAAATRAGAPGQGKRFHPHLSLARSRYPADVRDLVEALSGFEGTAWTADAIHLMRSHLGRQVRYETVRTWPLRDTS